MTWQSRSQQLRRAAFRLIAGHRRERLPTALAELARSYLSAYENNDGSCLHDGELDLLGRLTGAGIETVIDVGAHHGDWTIAASRILSGVTIDAVEPAPESAAILRAQVAHLPKVRVHECALGAANYVATLHFDPNHSQMASLVDSTQGDGTTCDVAVLRGDDFLDQQGIERVDLLKIDAEGFDLDVLTGFGQAIADRRIRMVQFEVSPWNAARRVWIHDFVEGLPGYQLGRIFPHYVQPFQYDPACEDFRFRGNMFALRGDESALRALILPG